MAESGEVQLVLFSLAGELYGVDVAQVHEIIVRQQVTRVPNAPEYVEGITNLRGKVIPVIDLRRRFHLKGDNDAVTHIVVMDLHGSLVGIMVDGVSEVVRISVDAIEAAPANIASEKSRFVSGIARSGERLVVVLDLDLAFTPEEIDTALVEIGDGR